MLLDTEKDCSNVEENKLSDLEKPVYNWVSITDELLFYSSELELGELLHGPNFGLFEAMSAIEMMDPKMDAGMFCNQAKRKVLNFPQALEAGVLQIINVENSVLISVIDHTYACLVTWLEGHSLAQTVFTNLFLHNPSIIEDKHLKFVSICMLKIVDTIRDRINKASVFEEEDFQPMTYGFHMASDVSDSKVITMLKEVEEEMGKIMKNKRTKSGDIKQCENELDYQSLVGVYSRLKFTRLFLSCLMSFNKEKSSGKSVTIPDATKCIAQMMEIMASIQESVSAGVFQNNDHDRESDVKYSIGFEPLVNQRLLPPTFPRYAQMKSHRETWIYLKELLDRLQVVCLLNETTFVHSTLDYFVEYSKKSPCVLSRSLLQLLFLAPNRKLFGVHNMVDVLRETIKSFIAPPALVSKSQIFNSSQVKEYIDGFLSHASQPICSIFQITGHNRARQRDKWGHLLEELANLQDEADKVDAYLHNILKKHDTCRQHLACFGNWVLYHTLHTILKYTLAGFELELYAVHEYHYIYWYLYECIFHWLLSTLSRADNFLAEQDSILEQQKGRQGKKNKNKKRKSTHSREITIMQATQKLCGGYYWIILGLEKDEKLKKPKFDFDSEEVRYNHRFLPFANVSTPPPIQYAHFREMTQMPGDYENRSANSAADMYKWSCNCFQQAKTLFEGISNPSDEIQTIIKVVKTNFIVAKLLLGGHKKDCKEPPEFEFTMHKIYPVIKLF